MTGKQGGFDPFDPFGIFGPARDAYLRMAAKHMVEFVNTESYAVATGQVLDGWLTLAGPLRQTQQAFMKQVLEQWGMPSRDELTALANRMTQVETRLDDLDARLDGIEAKLDRIADMLGSVKHDTGLHNSAGLAVCRRPPDSEEKAA